MKTVTSPQSLTEALAPLRAAGKRIGFVPTMGNLHQGHLALVQRANREADVVVVSIFVNPLQFGANEDLDTYPRTMAEDCQKLEQLGVALLFAPDVNAMYPNGQADQTRVQVPLITDRFCGASRHGHFDGVSTVVCKLFNMVQPDIAVFGQKDFQQLAVIRKMVEDLCIPVTVIGEATCRAEDGLALSSRNQYLSPSERQIAPLLYQTLQESRRAIDEEKADPAETCQKAAQKLQEHGFSVDYYDSCDAKTLQSVSPQSREIAILAAVFLGQTRLIDNVYFPLNRLTN